MQIIDKYGYLESALDYIERNIVSGRGLQKIAKKTGIKEDFLKSLSLSLKGLSEGKFFTLVSESLEDKHSSLSGSVAEVSSVDISIEEGDKKNIYVLLVVSFDIADDGESGDSVNMDIKIFSKNNIKIDL